MAEPDDESNKKQTLICADHEKRVSAEIRTFYESGEFCDIVLIAGVDDFRLPAHRMILSASSGYFRTMFRSNLSDAKAPEITLEQWDGETLKSIVDFMYTPTIEIMNENVENVLRAADFFQVNSLVTSCCTFMMQQLDTCNCLRVVFFAEQHNYSELLEKALAFTHLNFEQVSKEQEFLEMTDEQLARFLASDEIRVSSEKSLLLSVVDWIKHDADNRQSSVLSLLKLIRFPLLEAKHIVENREYLCKSPECQTVVLDWLQYLLSPSSHSQFPHALTIPRKSCKKLYFISGWDNTSKFNVQKFDYERDEWSSLEWPRPILRRKFFAACVIDNLLVLGGGDSGGRSTDEVECLDLQTLKWSRLPQMSMPRRWFALAELDGHLYAMGGIDSNWTNSVEKYNFKTNTWTEMPPMNSQLMYTQSAVVDGVLYAICAENRGLECYDPQTNKWSRLPPKNEFSAQYALGAVGGYLYAVGGHYAEGRSKTVERFDPKTRKWTKVASLKVGRSRISVTAFNNKLFACGGHDGREFLKIVEEYDPETDKWTQLASLQNEGDSCSHVLAI
ncbi:kelch-like protein 4 isoform X2 [Episyrphus balteatus]|nr:kelch-like protein 4 isoform X2 [Episyrphus balteatus]